MYKKYFDIFEEAVKTQTAGAVNDEELGWIRWKDVHSRRVLTVGERLLNQDKALQNIRDNFYEESIAALLLHDIGRFYQYENGVLNRKIDHGILGAKVLENDFNITNQYILLGMKYHDCMDFIPELESDEVYKNLSSDDKNNILLIEKLVRDADKLENFQKYMEAKQLGYFGEALDKLSLNKEAVADFYKGKLINKNILLDASIFEAGIYFMAWQNELFFSVSRDFIREINFNESVLSLLKDKADKLLQKDKKSLQSTYDDILEELGKVRNYLKENNLITE